jgi:hypothetical protein
VVFDFFFFFFLQFFYFHFLSPTSSSAPIGDLETAALVRAAGYAAAHALWCARRARQSGDVIIPADVTAAALETARTAAPHLTRLWDRSSGAP